MGIDRRGRGVRRPSRRVAIVAAVLAGAVPVAGAPWATAEVVAAAPESVVVTITGDVVDPDDGEISLREAVDLANATSGYVMIVLGHDEPYVLDRCAPDPGDEDANADGDLDVRVASPAVGTVDIVGDPSDPAVIRQTCEYDNGSGAGIISSGPSTELRLAGLVLEGARWHGEATGCRTHAAVHATAPAGLALELADVEVTGFVGRLGSGCSWVEHRSAGVVAGEAEIRRVVLRSGVDASGLRTTDPTGSNVVDDTEVFGNSNLHGGGGLHVAGDLALSGSVVADNYGSGGAGVHVLGAAQVTDTHVIENASELAGGGIEAADLVSAQSVVARNTAESGGGGIAVWGDAHLVDTIVEGNAAGFGGGGIDAGGGHLTMERTVVRDNQGQFGAGASADTANVEDSTIEGNHAADIGGGLVVLGLLAGPDAPPSQIVGSTISKNDAVIDAGGVLGEVALEDSVVIENSAAGDGGGLLVNGESRIERSEVRGNRSRDGAGIYHDDWAGGQLDVVDSTIEENQAIEVGGGIWSGGPALVERSTIARNGAGSGGGIHIDHTPGERPYTSDIDDSTVEENEVTGDGGGVDAPGGVRIVGSDVRDNDAGGLGGGIHGVASIERSTVAGNAAGGAGGGAFLTHVGDLETFHEVVESTFSGNSAPAGAAMQVDVAALRMHRSTVAENTSSGPGGALYLWSSGAHIERSTLAGNRSEGGPGEADALDLVVAADDSSYAGVDVEASVLGSTAPGIPSCAVWGDAEIESWSVSGNVAADDSCGNVGTQPHDRANVGDVGLQPLADIGGPTETMLPERGSPVLEVVPHGANGCGIVEVYDQRGVARPQGPRCDSGAVEVELEDCTAAGFADVGADHRFCAAIGWAWWTAIVDGYDDGTFRPTVPVSRQAMAAFLARSEGVEVAGPPCPSAPFPDVPATHRFCGPIGWAADGGIAAGYDDGLFRPTAPVSRQAAVTFLARAEGLDPATLPCAGDVFDDVGPGHRFCGAIEWAAAQGLTSGYGDGTFRPTSPVSRQAAAAFLHRVATPDD